VFLWPKHGFGQKHDEPDNRAHLLDLDIDATLTVNVVLRIEHQQIRFSLSGFVFVGGERTFVFTQQNMHWSVANVLASHSPWAWPTSCSAGGSARRSPPEEQRGECRPHWHSASPRRTQCGACRYATHNLAFSFRKRLSSLKFHTCAVGNPRDSVREGQLFLGVSWFPSVPRDSGQSSCKVTSTSVVSYLDLLRYNAASSGKSFPAFLKNVRPLSSKDMSKKNATYHVHSKSR
jgi:hypothetical protein